MFREQLLDDQHYITQIYVLYLELFDFVDRSDR